MRRSPIARYPSQLVASCCLLLGCSGEADGFGSSIDLKTAVALGARYSFTLSLSAGKLSVTINGKQVYSRTPSAAVANDAFYFKFGNYDQSTSDGTPTATPYSVVEAYQVDLVHE